MKQVHPSIKFTVSGMVMEKAEPVVTSSRFDFARQELDAGI